MGSTSSSTPAASARVDEERLAVALGQRRDRPDGLGLELQSLATRDEQMEGRAAGDQVGHVVGAVRKKMLEVVEEQQPLLAGKRGDEGRGQRLAGLLGDVESACDRGDNERRVAQRGERDPEDAVGVAVGRGGGGLEREPRLAGAAGPGEGEQPRVGLGEQCGDRRQFALTAEKRGRRDGEVRAVERLQRRKSVGSRRARAGRAGSERRGP